MSKPEPEETRKILERLHRGAAEYTCGGYLFGQPSLERYEIYLTLIFERLQRKIQVVNDLWKESLEDWNQAFYLLYFRTLGDKTNQQAFLTLARRVPYRILLRERATPHAVEALLLGTSGLLNLYPVDEYIMTLIHIFEHLRVKYSLEAMSPRDWQLNDIRPMNHPLLRIVQAGAFFMQDQFVIAKTLDCHSEERLREIFCVEAPEYWNTHYIPCQISSSRPKRIGNFKANMIGINLVTVFQFAQGIYLENEEMRDRALELLEKLPPEDNRYIRSWCYGGAPNPANAMETQALLELAIEYCAARACERCPIGRRVLHQIQRAKAEHE